MSKIRLFTDLKDDRIEYKKNAFSMNHFRQNVHFPLAVIFLKFWMELKRRFLSIRQGSTFS